MPPTLPTDCPLDSPGAPPPKAPRAFASARRRWVQFVSFLALHSSFWGAELKWLCIPVLSCHSCALSWFACPVGVMVHYSGYHVFPFLALGMLLLAGVLLGRLWCGWVCPFGFLQDLLYKIRSPKFVLPSWTRWIKYGMLLVFVLLIPFFFGESTLWSFCRACPAAALQVTLPDMIAGQLGPIKPTTVVKLVVLVLVLVLAVLSSRSFCKMFCPIGAFLGPLNYVSLWLVKAPLNCTSCDRCDRVCPVSGTPSGRMSQGRPANYTAECLTCHECRAVCKQIAEAKQRKQEASRPVSTVLDSSPSGGSSTAG